MKIQVIAEIEGDFILNTSAYAKLYPYEFLIFENNDKRYISITKPIIDYINLVPRLYVKNGVTTIEATKPEAYKDLEEWLYYIEAMGAFNFEVNKIHLDELEIKWIYETEEEKGSIPIISFKRNRVRRTVDKNINNSNLSQLVMFRKMLPESHIPFSYYRQARVFFNENDYYFSFINYFMMLEFMFADGKFQKGKMMDNFLKSDLLKLCILNAMKMLENCNEKEQNYSWLLKECKTRQKKIDFEGIVFLLIEYRGLLSHATNRSKKFLLNVEQLRPITFFISLICFLLCGYIQVFCCSNKVNRKNMIKQRIDQLMNGKV